MWNLNLTIVLCVWYFLKITFVWSLNLTILVSVCGVGAPQSRQPGPETFPLPATLKYLLLCTWWLLMTSYDTHVTSSHPATFGCISSLACTPTMNHADLLPVTKCSACFSGDIVFKNSVAWKIKIYASLAWQKLHWDIIENQCPCGWRYIIISFHLYVCKFPSHPKNHQNPEKHKKHWEHSALMNDNWSSIFIAWHISSKIST